MPNADDRAEIVQATHLYARGLDRFDPKEALSAYTDDAVWDATGVGLERYEGRDQVLAFFERDAGSMSEQYHLMTNHIVEFDDDDHAHGTNYVLAEGRTTSGASIKAAAFNVDTYRRTADGWKIASRVITPLTTPEMEGFEA
jgi:ketosteroid isomerase-like protein